MQTALQDVMRYADGLAKYVIGEHEVHLKAARVFAQRHVALGIVVILLSTIVGSSTFISLSDMGQDNPVVIFGTGVLSIIAAFLAALQTFLNWSEKAQAHKLSASKYSALRRSLGVYLMQCRETTDRRIAVSDLKTIVDDLNKLEGECPTVPESLLTRRRTVRSNGGKLRGAHAPPTASDMPRLSPPMEAS
jgi:hypothetical protein